jgi:type IV pilus assembly protein PilB
MKNTKKKRLGEKLIERGSLSVEDLQSALNEQRGKTILLGDLLLARGLVSKQDLAATLKETLGIDYVDVTTVSIDPSVLKLIPRDMATENSVLPLLRDGKKLVVAMANPQNIRFIDQMRFTLGLEVSPVLAFSDEISLAIEHLYSELPEKRRSDNPIPSAGLQGSNSLPTSKVVRSSLELAHHIVTIDEDQAVSFESSRLLPKESGRDIATEVELARQNQSTPAVRIFSSIISKALRERASDVHIDPGTNGSIARLRVDGMLRDLMEIPHELKSALISRIKILADMDIAERRMPQDGRVMVQIGQDKIDLRVSTLPTQHGEKAVIRLLNPNATAVDFAGLGLSEVTASLLRKVLTQPQGMLLVTGPTGSGKTTTLYAALNQIRSRTKNIITVEDPIEYVLEGINQVQVNIKAGRTFATCLRSILRQDPNVIMVGEIRDAETADIALSSSQTGHMVLSTLHTNDSIAAITRLLDLGITAYLIAASVSAFMAQRLVRKLCVCCREEDVSPEFAALLLSAGVNNVKRMSVPVGCPACHESGYKGRIGIYEILFMTEQIRAAIQSGSSSDEIRKIVRGGGFRPMQEQALEKVRTGQTSLEEVFRVFTFETVSFIRCASCHRDIGPAVLFCPYCGSDRRAAVGREGNEDHLEEPVITV